MKPISKFLNEAIKGFKKTTQADVRKMNKTKVGKKMMTISGDSFEFVAAYHMADGFEGFKDFYERHNGDEPWMLSPGGLKPDDVVVAVNGVGKNRGKHIKLFNSSFYFA